MSARLEIRLAVWAIRIRSAWAKWQRIIRRVYFWLEIPASVIGYGLVALCTNLAIVWFALYLIALFGNFGAAE